MSAYTASLGPEQLTPAQRVTWSGDNTKGALPVANPDGSSIAGGGGGGSQYADQAIPGTPLANLLAFYTGSLVQFVNATHGLPVNIVSGAGSGGTALADLAAFTTGTTSFTPSGGVFNDTPPAGLTTGQAGTFRITTQRALHTNLRTAAGTEIGNTSGALNVSVQNASIAVTGTFFQATQPVSLAAAVDVSDRAARLAGHVTVDNASLAVTGTFFQATQPVSLAAAVDVGDRTARLLGHVTVDNASLAVTGTFWQATQPVSLAAAVDVSDRAARLLGVLSAGTNVIGHVIADSGSTTAVTGTVAVTESGTWTVQPGNTANTTPWLVTDSPATSGGLSMHSRLLTADTNLTSVKASTGQIYGIQAFGTGSAPYWLKLYNKASAPVIASDSALIVKRILIPANATAANGGGVTVPINDMGLAFSSGIAYACTGLQADTDTTATAAAGAVNIDYK